MRNADIKILKRKSTTGVVALTSRTFILQIIAFVSTALLTWFLSPSVFGVFYVVSAIIAFLGYFSDIGLAAALVQKKDPVTEDDLRTTFTIQQILVGSAVALTFLLSPIVSRFYGLNTDGTWLLRALALSFFLSSLKTIPSIILERGLEFQKLVIPQILETLGFYMTALILASTGFGIMSFTWAVVVRGVIGLVAIYWIAPWKMSIGFSQASAKKLLRFGVPFQLNAFLALLKDDLLTVFLGKILPFEQVGYIGWAKKWAEVPLRLIMDNVIRITFPAFSRLQEDIKILGRLLEKTLFGLAFSMFPLSVGLLFFMRPLISFLPKYAKWEPALFSFYLFVIASVLSGLSTPLTNVLNALGLVRTTFMLMLLWTALTWVLTVVLVQLIGFNGVALSLLLITVTIILVVH
ncbi:MAG: oligosaccharide flippase family protein, partial [bacterium]|nr:oligosaccharide flippase family protein [bacterium]